MSRGTKDEVGRGELGLYALPHHPVGRDKSGPYSPPTHGGQVVAKQVETGRGESGPFAHSSHVGQEVVGCEVAGERESGRDDLGLFAHPSHVRQEVGGRGEMGRNKLRSGGYIGAPPPKAGGTL